MKVRLLVGGIYEGMESINLDNAVFNCVPVFGGVNILEVDLNAAGATFEDTFDGESWFREAPQPVTPTDTLGAGDAFISGFLVSYVGGQADKNCRPASLIEISLKKAALFAAETCQVQGAFGHGLSY